MPGGPERRYQPSPEINPKNILDHGIEQLLEGLKQGTSQRLENYLAFTARFHRYSVNNQMLIYMQRPNATLVAGYRKWQAEGYQVARGEKSIRILAPRSHKRINHKTGEEEQVVSFATVSVFDVSQLIVTQEHPVPTFFSPLPDDQPELFERLAKVVRADGISLAEGWTGDAQGLSLRKKIVLRRGMDSQNRLLALIHEYAHELLHWDAEGKEQPRPTKECHAEAIAFIVAHHFGIYNPYSADYLQNWGTTPQDLKAELEIVRKTATYIIDRIEKPEETGSQAVESEVLPEMI